MRVANLFLLAGMFSLGAQAHADSMSGFDLSSAPAISMHQTESLDTSTDLVDVPAGLSMGAASASQPTAVTPEPATVVLLATGLFSIGVAAMRKRRQAQLRMLPAVVTQKA
jgi:hypothetical protein